LKDPRLKKAFATDEYTPIVSYYTYLYFDPSRNEPIYIGKGCGKRLFKHLNRKDNHPFTNRLKKMGREGVTPIITKLCDGVDAELALLVEMEAISKFGRKDLLLGPLLNLTDGGEGLIGPSEATRLKIGASNTGKTLGIKKSKESNDRRSKSLTGLKKTEDHINKINRNPEKIRKTTDKHRGMKRTEETKHNISLSRLGKPTHNKDRIVYSNFDTGHIIHLLKDQMPPEGYSRGNIKSQGKAGGAGKKWWYNSTTLETKSFLPGYEPLDWKPGNPRLWRAK
jgi:hypothetical protein